MVRESWRRQFTGVLLALAFLALIAVPGGPVLAEAGSRRVELHRYQLGEVPSPFGWTNFAALDVGDVDGDGQNELVLSTPDELAKLPAEERNAPFRIETVRLAVAGSGQGVRLAGAPLLAGIFDLTVNGIAVADLYPSGPAEIWLAYQPKVGAVEFDGVAFQPKEAWQTWANKPVVLSRYGSRKPGVPGQEKLLALANRYSPEVAVGMITVYRPVKCPSKERDVQGAAFFSPKDRFVAGDVDGDGREELVAAYSKLSQQFPPRPFVVTDLWSGAERAALPEFYPDDVAVGDIDADGRVEVVLAENRPDEAGWPREASIRVLRWDVDRLAEVRRWTYPGAWAGDLAVGDADNDKQDDLVIALLQRVKDSREVILYVEIP